MRTLIVLVTFCLALPALAQQSAECRGKQTFDLGAGTTGCLLEVRQTKVTKTVRRDDGLGSSHSRGAILIKVALLGEYTEAWPTMTPRMRQICNLFLEQAKQQLGATSVRTVVVEKTWPNVAWPASTPRYKTIRWRTPRQAAMMNRNCRAVKYFK